MSEFTLADVVKKYIDLRDEQAAISEKFKAELAPGAEQMETIEKYLMAHMDKEGLDSIKTPNGTPYKVISKSVKAIDMEAFKLFALQPAIDALSNLPNMPDIVALLTAGIRWDMLDFRPLKKGVVEYTEESGQLPPGLTIDNFTKINIRRS